MNEGDRHGGNGGRRARQDIGAGNDALKRVDPGERDQVEHGLPKRAAVLHETLRLQGEEELARPIAALAWSAVAAGLTMGFSMLMRALLQARLPEAEWTYLVDSLGYCFGFVVVILARQQLFTENTLTVVLPLMSCPTWAGLGGLLRLWGVVLAGNLVGATLFAAAAHYMHIFDAPTGAAMIRIGEEVMANSAWEMFSKGVMAGWLIATMVWLIPAAEQAKVWIIIGVTYLIGIGGFTHIIVGAVEILYLVFEGRLGLRESVMHFGMPTLLGNIVGGSFVFALVSHAQVRNDRA
ncbi:formate/nitrite transporter family protein [Coralloluteibacterium stylophorae]|uniref:Formate/nitrite transporter family protein n=1 Tax=Coralloluteibacterium stylophorae TaxID=1776034 RepID=A0A8J7VVQ0_9GAMM|nr:formate/nitrite transporter family protein [Coralloluteibacterium stylophorae]MBS7456286.1 formate/nitrite transporter family protein [Coralloluteibacterium stylophorae]